MRWLTSVAILVLLGAWLAASNHCYLETAGLLPVDDCHATEQSSASQSDPCENDCKLVEKSVYKAQDNERFSICAVLLPLILQPVLESEPIRNESVAITAWPPETLHLPQFVASTSLPVRAPSFVS